MFLFFFWLVISETVTKSSQRALVIPTSLSRNEWTLCSGSWQFIRYMRAVSFHPKQQACRRESRLSEHMIKLYCIVQGLRWASAELYALIERHASHIKQNFNHIILRLINQLCFFFLGILTLLPSRQWLLNVICNRMTAVVRRTWSIERKSTLSMMTTTERKKKYPGN